jgi:AraC-like DNA-binding protein
LAITTWKRDWTVHHRVRLLASPIAGVWVTDSATGHQFDRHFHDTYSFGLLDAGAQRWRSRRGTVDAFAGAIINTVPCEVHDGRPLGVLVRRWRILSVEPEVMNRLTGHSGPGIDIREPVILDERLTRVLRRLFRRIERWSHGDRSDVTSLAIQADVTEACVLFAGRHGTATVSSSDADVDVAIVRDRLADDPCGAPSLDGLADMTSLSRYQLLRRFRGRYGLPPHAWLLSRRAERARELIRDGETLAAAAMRSGFADQSHMTRTFARFYGYTPGQWRRTSHPVAIPLKKV